MNPLRRQPAGKWRSILATAVLCHRITPFWRPAYPLVFLHARRLCRRGRFEPLEAFRLGLFLPQVPCRHGEYVSRRQLIGVQESLNPADWTPLFENRDLFYRYCMAVETPIPRLYAIVHARLPGWTYTGRLLHTRQDWIAFFDNSLPAEFAVKPAQGVCGQRAGLFRRTRNGYTDATGTDCRTGDLYDMLVADVAGRSIIQERLHNHPELARLSGEDTLQMVRIITLVDNDGQVHLLHAHLRVIDSDETTNIPLQELAGDIEAPVDLRYGVLRAANRIPGTGAMAVTLSAHPRTRIAFEGFRLPFWTEACHVVQQTALNFLPVRTIGWDIALTPHGPVIVAGDIWWDPPNQHGDMGEILRALSNPSLPKIQQAQRPAGDHSPWHSLFEGDGPS